MAHMIWARRCDETGSRASNMRRVSEVRGSLHPKVAALVAREDIEQKTPAWHQMRGKMVTASQVASVIGKNRYQSADALLREKLTVDRTNTGSFATEWGNRYEDEAIAKYERASGRRVLRFG